MRRLRKAVVRETVSTPQPPHGYPYHRPPCYLLITRRDLARALGVSMGYVRAMKRAGYQPPEPTWYTIDTAEKWLSEHPGFRVHRVYTSKDRKTRKAAYSPNHRLTD